MVMAMKLKAFCIYHREDIDKRFTEEQKQKLLDHHAKALMIANWNSTAKELEEFLTNCHNGYKHVANQLFSYACFIRGNTEGISLVSLIIISVLPLE